VAQKRLLPAGTKEEILCSLAEEPKTIAQLARQLSLSGPSVFTHVSEMVASELLREAEGRQKRYAAERYYEPNFPVVCHADRAEFDEPCEELAGELAALFARHLARLREAFDETTLAARGWGFDDLAHYLYARAHRDARALLEARGALPPRAAHLNGVEWVFWAEESADGEEPT